VSFPWGFKEVTGHFGWGFARPAAQAWLAQTIGEGKMLREVAAAHPQSRELKGRGPVYVIPGVGAGAEWVVRPYRRGGRVAAPLLGDRYLRGGLPRPLAEVGASQEAIRRAIPTPPVIAGAIYPSGPFYRADLVTEFVPRSRTLAAVFFHHLPANAATRIHALRAAGQLIGRMANKGLEHPDLNAKNILLVPDKGLLLGLVLDLDRCRVGDPIPPLRMLRRLEQSMRKLASATGDPLTDKEWADLRNAVNVTA
jgi:3-deoxy-D-manno-octulosonic acid kinase